MRMMRLGFSHHPHSGECYFLHNPVTNRIGAKDDFGDFGEFE
jgi:hypothetical protein